MSESWAASLGMSLDKPQVTTTSANCPAAGIKFFIIEMSAGCEGEGKAAFFQYRIPAGLTLANFHLKSKIIFEFTSINVASLCHFCYFRVVVA